MPTPSSAGHSRSSLLRTSQISPAAPLSPTKSSPSPHDARAEARAERDAEKIAVAPGAPRLGEQRVDLGKEAVQRFAVREEIAVVVDEDGHAEPVFEHRPERDPAAKGGKVAEIADHARRVVRGARKGEGDGRHGRRPPRPAPGKSPRRSAPGTRRGRRRGRAASRRDATSRFPAIAEKRKLVPPASSVRTTRESVSQGLVSVTTQNSGGRATRGPSGRRSTRAGRRRQAGRPPGRPRRP